MAILGVLLGITMCAVAWCVKEITDLKVAASDKSVLFDMVDRLAALEKRKPVVAEPAAKPANLRRQWNENLPAVEQ